MICCILEYLRNIKIASSNVERLNYYNYERKRCFNVQTSLECMEYYIGQTAEFSRTICEKDVVIFAELTGDNNELHMNESVARKSIFGERIVHGALLSAFISTVLGSYMPGQGTIYLSQTSKYVKPVKINDTITVRVKITEIINRKAVIETNIFDQDENCVLLGSAQVLLP